MPLAVSREPLAVVDRINAERLAVLAWSRAILLQVAHPLVASGVSEHSGFSGGGLSAFRRLASTIRAMRTIAFGDRAAREQAIAGIRRIHDRVNGRLGAPAGTHAGGAPYSAHDPALLLWVHVTLIESVVLLHDQLVERLRDEARDEYVASAAPIALALGALEAQVPRTWAELQRVLDTEYASGRVVVTDAARGVAAHVLSPPMAWLAWPGPALNALLTVGSLPPAVRDAYGFTWDAPRARRFARVVRALRAIRAVTPAWIALWPEARRRTGDGRDEGTRH